MTLLATIRAADKDGKDSLHIEWEGKFEDGFLRRDDGLELGRDSEDWKTLRSILIGSGADEAAVREVRYGVDLDAIAEQLVGLRAEVEIEGYGGRVIVIHRPPLTGIAATAWNYASSLGWYVFPLGFGTKFPLKDSHGHHDATNDVERIRQLFTQRPRLNIAVNPAPSGLVVVDVDVRNGGDETLARLVKEHGVLPETPRGISGHQDGSTHYFYRGEEDGQYPAKLGDGIEVIHHGYVVLPPSAWCPEEGRKWGQWHRYRWDVGAHIEDIPLAPVPAWIAGGVRGASSPTTRQAPVGPAADSFFAVAFGAAGLLGIELPGGKIAVRCPWAEQHSDGRGRGEDSSTVVLPPTTEDRLGAFACAHAHCAGRGAVDVVIALPKHAIAKAAARYPRALGKLAWRSVRARQEAKRR